MNDAASDDAGGRYVRWLKRARHSGEYSDVIVRVAPEEFNLHLLTLLVESTYFQKLVDADPARNQERKLVVDLPDFPGGPESFHVVVDHCYGSTEHEISTSNVVKVICASDFLGIESLKNRALKFLDETVFRCSKSCLAVLATYDCKDGHPGGDQIFHKCKDAFLDNIRIKKHFYLPEYADCPLFYSVTDLLTVATLLPANMAKDIYDCIRREAPGLFYGVEEDYTTPPPPAILLYRRKSTELTGSKELEFDEGSVSWVEKLPKRLPDLAQRAMLLSCLCELIMQDKSEERVVRNFTFLCSLLIEVVEVNKLMVSKEMLWEGLESLIDAAESLVALNMDQVQPSVLQKCEFPTLVSIVKSLPSEGLYWDTGWDHGRMLDPLAKVLDDCLLSHLNRKSLSVAQVLTVYRNFPNDERYNHEGLCNVFTDELNSKTMSFEQRQDLLQMLDFQKLPDRWVSRIFQELDLGHEPRLLKQVLKIHKDTGKRLKLRFGPCNSSGEVQQRSYLNQNVVLVKHINVFMTGAAQVEEAKNEQLQRQAVELTEMREEKLKLGRELQVKSAEFIKMRDEKLRLECKLEDATAKVAAVIEEKSNLTMTLANRTAELMRELEEEREERLCVICLERPRDAQCLPCKHFLYCRPCLNQHIQQSRTCPTCRTPSTGVNSVSAGAS